MEQVQRIMTIKIHSGKDAEGGGGGGGAASDGEAEDQRPKPPASPSATAAGSKGVHFEDQVGEEGAQ